MILEFNANSFDAQFASIHTKLDVIEKKMDTLTTDHNTRLVELEKRVERQKGWTAGASAIAGGLGAATTALGTWFFERGH